METQSQNIDQLIKSLIVVQSKLTSVIYDSKNPHFKSKYASLPAVWNHCKAVLHENGFCVMQTVHPGALEPELVTTLAHVSGQFIRSFVPLIMEKRTAQAQGSAITYARRYGLMAAIGLCADDDDDGNAATIPQQTVNAEPVSAIISSAQYKALEAALTNNTKLKSLILDFLKTEHGCRSLAECPVAEYDKLYKRALKEQQQEQKA